MKKQIKIIRESNPKDMEKEVNKHIEDGWKIKGSLKVSEHSFCLMLYKK